MGANGSLTSFSQLILTFLSQKFYQNFTSPSNYKVKVLIFYLEIIFFYIYMQELKRVFYL